MSRDTFDCHNWVWMTGVWWVEARDAAQDPIVHRTAPPSKNYPTQDVNSSNIEKLCAKTIKNIAQLCLRNSGL